MPQYSIHQTMKIYHNPRCSKSRQGLQLIKDAGIEPEIIEYLKQPLTEAELKEIISLLGIRPIELVRKNEAIWKQEFKGKELSDQQVIEAMVSNPKLIERPIAIKDGKAVIGRPPENFQQLF